MGVFGDINRVELLGNMTQDIDLRYTANGNPVTNFGIATNRNYKSGEEWKEEVTFHNVVVWGTDAEQLSQKAKKGTRIYIQGRLQTRSWESPEGKTQYKTEIVADKVILLDRYIKGEGNYQGNSDDRSQNVEEKNESPAKKASKPVKVKVEEKNSNDEDVIDPDDLPF